MIGVVVPVHNEADTLGDCLGSIAVAARARRLQGEAVRVVVVLDACHDASEAVARVAGVDLISIDNRSGGFRRCPSTKTWHSWPRFKRGAIASRGARAPA